jgi:hypothetical protein
MTFQSVSLFIIKTYISPGMSDSSDKADLVCMALTLQPTPVNTAQQHQRQLELQSGSVLMHPWWYYYLS